MLAFEPVLLKYNPDWLVVVGDVNSTVACALVAAKLGVRVAHVEAGLRSGDMTMPEEVNRRLTDVISDLLLIPSEDARENLLREGVEESKIKFVGNVMIDTLVKLLPLADQLHDLESLELLPRKYVLVTMHRPANVDDLDQLRELARGLEAIAQRRTVVFPVHPRTRQRMEQGRVETGSERQTGCAVELSRFPERHERCRSRRHGFRRSAGGDELFGHPLPDHPAEYRASHYHHPRHQSARGAHGSCPNQSLCGDRRSRRTASRRVAVVGRRRSPAHRAGDPGRGRGPARCRMTDVPDAADQFSETIATDQLAKKWYDQHVTPEGPRGNRRSLFWQKYRLLTCDYRLATTIKQDIRRLQREWFGDVSNKRVLELGCSHGTVITLELARQAKSFVGIDLSEPAISILNKNSRSSKPEAPRAMCGDFLTAKFPESPFDLIYTNSVIHHFHDRDVIFSAIHSKLAEGGALSA